LKFIDDAIVVLLGVMCDDLVNIIVANADYLFALKSVSVLDKLYLVFITAKFTPFFVAE
jgi:hypothetical protein